MSKIPLISIGGSSGSVCGDGIDEGGGGGGDGNDDDDDNDEVIEDDKDNISFGVEAKMVAKLWSLMRI